MSKKELEKRIYGIECNIQRIIDGKTENTASLELKKICNKAKSQINFLKERLELPCDKCTIPTVWKDLKEVTVSRDGKTSKGYVCDDCQSVIAGNLNVVKKTNALDDHFINMQRGLQQYHMSRLCSTGKA